MARNGTGGFSLTTGNPVVTGSTISSTVMNNTLTDIASALTQSISQDGQTTITGNLPMSGFKHTGVANATNRTDYCSAGQAQDNTFDWLSSISGTDTITASIVPSITAYTAGQTFRFVATGANTTTAVTININSLGAKNITKNGTTALAIGDIKSGAVLEIIYDGTQFQVLGVGYAATGANNDITSLTALASVPTVVTTQLNLKANLASPTFTGTVVLPSSTITPTMLSLAASSIGVGQTYTNVLVTPGRAYATNYTNLTGKPIYVCIQISQSAAASQSNSSLIVDGVSVDVVQIVGAGGSGENWTLKAIVPAGSIYSCPTPTGAGGGTLNAWVELR